MPLERQARDYVLAKGRQTGNEHLLAFNGDGNVIADREGTKGHISLPKETQDPAQQITVHHNHPQNLPLSSDDIEALADPGLETLWAHGHGGTVTNATPTDAARERIATHNGALKDALAAARNALYLPIGYTIQSGKISLHDGDRLYAEARNRMLHDAGVITYESNFDPAPLIEKPTSSGILVAPLKTSGAPSMAENEGFYGIIEGPSEFGPPADWEKHLAEMRAMKFQRPEDKRRQIEKAKGGLARSRKLHAIMKGNKAPAV